MVDGFNALGIIPMPSHWMIQFLFLCTGMYIIGFGVNLYLSAAWGSGPRDSLFLALCDKSGKSVSIVKATLEVSVSIVAILLGGPIGLGTVILALFSGVAIDHAGYFLKIDVRKIQHKTLSFKRKGTKVRGKVEV